MFVVLVVAAFAAPLTVQFVGEIPAVVVRRFLIVGGIEARLIVKLSGFRFIKIEQCHNRLFLRSAKIRKKDERLFELLERFGCSIF